MATQLTEGEIRAVAETIVKEAKRTAHYEQGTLFRSISYTYIRGLLTFREIFYGQYNNNSQLEKLARNKVPNGVSYQIIFTDFNGSVKSKSRVKQGNASQRNILGNIWKTGTSKIKALIASNKAKNLNNGKT